MQTTIKKRYENFPFAHRQHTHCGHCAKIHGHSWAFEFEFAAAHRDPNGFILDFGDLKWLREFLNRNFDHTLVLAENDPILSNQNHHLFAALDPLSNINPIPSASCEGIAAYTFKCVEALVWTKTAQRVSLVSVTVWESPHNCATIRQTEHGSTPA